jgi:hypothetical protein
MGVKPQKAMVVAKTRRAWDKAVDKLCASGVQLCKTQMTGAPMKKAAKRKA